MTAETSLKTVVSDYPRNLGVKVLAADEFSVQSLMKLGLTEYEARIYVVLTKMGPRNASEISFLGKVPRPKTYGAIRGLESKGLLRIVPGKPERYMAVSPNDVLIPLVEKLNKETTECVQVVENLAMAFESSRYVYTEKPYERYDLWSVRGRDKVYKRDVDKRSLAGESTRENVRSALAVTTSAERSCEGKGTLIAQIPRNLKR